MSAHWSTFLIFKQPKDKKKPKDVQQLEVMEKLDEEYNDLYDKLLGIMDPIYSTYAVCDEQLNDYKKQCAELHSSFCAYGQKVIERKDAEGIRRLIMFPHKSTSPEVKELLVETNIKMLSSFPEAKKLLIESIESISLIESILKMLFSGDHSLKNAILIEVTLGLPKNLADNEYCFGVLRQVILNFSGSNLANTEFVWREPIEELFEKVVAEFVNMMDLVLDSKEPQGQMLVDALLIQLYNQMIDETNESFNIDYFGEVEKIDILVNKYQIQVSQSLLDRVFKVFMPGDKMPTEHHRSILSTLLSLVTDKDAHTVYSQFMSTLVFSPNPSRSGRSTSLPTLSGPSADDQSNLSRSFGK